jgi:hypothetical protein
MHQQTQVLTEGDEVASETPAEHPLTDAVELYATAVEQHAAAVAVEAESQADYLVKEAAKKAADLCRDEAEFAHSTLAIAQRELTAMHREYDDAGRHAFAISNAQLLAASQRDPAAVEAMEHQLQETHRTCTEISDRADARQRQALLAIGVSTSQLHFPNSFYFHQLYNLRQVRDACATTAIAADQALEAASSARAQAFHGMFKAKQKVEHTHMRLRQIMKNLYGPPEFPEDR